MPRVVGNHGEKDHDDLVAQLVDYEQFFRQQLQALYQDMVNRWKLYLAQREDKRLPHEKWRANTFVPWPFITMEAKVAAMCEIMNSVDPPIQAEGVGPEDDHPAVKMQHVHAYTLLKNKWLLQQDLNYRDMVVQGTAPWKLVWAHRSRRVKVHPTDDQINTFHEAIDEVVRR